MRVQPWTLLGIVVLAGCVHQNELVPAPSALTVPGKPQVAAESVEGVRVQVDSTAWHGRAVEDVLSPVLVSIDNGSSHALRIAYGEFTLGGASGFRLAALPPYQVMANDVIASSGPGLPPGFVGDGFYLTPWAVPYYSGVEPWSGPFPYDPLYYNRWYGAWPTDLPNEDVIRRALPEGVLAQGGKASGFLYFANQPKGTELTFFMSLVDAEKGQAFGTIAIPFTVK